MLRGSALDATVCAGVVGVPIQGVIPVVAGGAIPLMLEYVETVLVLGHLAGVLSKTIQVPDSLLCLHSHNTN